MWENKLSWPHQPSPPACTEWQGTDPWGLAGPHPGLAGAAWGSRAGQFHTSVWLPLLHLCQHSRNCRASGMALMTPGALGSRLGGVWLSHKTVGPGTALQLAAPSSPPSCASCWEQSRTLGSLHLHTRLLCSWCWAMGSARPALGSLFYFISCLSQVSSDSGVQSPPPRGDGGTGAAAALQL